MSNDWYKDIVDFHKEVLHDNFLTYPHIQYDKKLLRQSLIHEEFKETIIALEDEDLEKIANGIVDSIVVLLGTAITYGIDIRPVWDEVHRTNMLKKGGKIRADGKQLKPEGWEPPNIKDIIEHQKWFY